MLGTIIGDIVGSRFEFDNIYKTDFELFTSECAFTDDSICTVAVADAIIRDEEFGKVLHEWCRRYPYPKGGYGGSFARWVYSNSPQPYGSFGNGSAMRVSPCGWLPTRKDALRMEKYLPSVHTTTPRVSRELNVWRTASTLRETKKTKHNSERWYKSSTATTST